MANERYCGIAKEATWGTAVGATDWMDIISGGFDEDNQFQIEETGRGYDQFHALLGNYKAEGSLEAQLNTETMGLILLSLLGAPTSGGGGDPYNHVFLSNNPGNPISLYIGDLVAAGEQKVTSALVKKLVIECVAGEVVHWNADLLAQKVEQSALQSPTFDTLDPIVFHEGDLQVGGGSIKTQTHAVKLTVERAVPDDGYSIGNRLMQKPWYGAVKVSWEMDLYFDELTAWKRFYDGSTGTSPGTSYTPFVTDLNLIRTAVTDALMVECDKTVFDVRNAKVDRRSRTIEKLTGRSYYDATNTAALKATLYNGIVSY